jgi:UDP-N-acetylglucosamine 4,6-dehydratase/5-epimerase
MISGKTMLVTGGTGSFGHTVVERCLESAVKEIRIFSRDEKKQEDMRHANPDPRLKFYIGDVRDYLSLHQALDGVDLVFHAAALKQVPSCEFHPMEAVRTNILGAENVMAAAVDRKVERVVMLSTDKALYPINAMGMTKAVMEKLTVAKSRLMAPGGTLFSCTRYGNVMASRGSVIPLFVAQLKAGKPLTLTDPDMTRFMMSLPDSVDLVLYAYEHARQGDILVQKAPACTLGDLAEAVQEVFKIKAEVQVIGARHGEKRHESLVAGEEAPRAENLGDYFRIPADTRNLNYAHQSKPEIGEAYAEGFTSANTRRLDVGEVVELLRSLDYIQDELRSPYLRSDGV